MGTRASASQQGSQKRCPKTWGNSGADWPGSGRASRPSHVRTVEKTGQSKCLVEGCSSVICHLSTTTTRWTRWTPWLNSQVTCFLAPRSWSWTLGAIPWQLYASPWWRLLQAVGKKHKSPQLDGRNWSFHDSLMPSRLFAARQKLAVKPKDNFFLKWWWDPFRDAHYLLQGPWRSSEMLNLFTFKWFI